MIKPSTEVPNGEPHNGSCRWELHHHVLLGSTRQSPLDLRPPWPSSGASPYPRVFLGSTRAAGDGDFPPKTHMKVLQISGEKVVFDIFLAPKTVNLIKTQTDEFNPRVSKYPCHKKNFPGWLASMPVKVLCFTCSMFPNLKCLSRKTQNIWLCNPEMTIYSISFPFLDPEFMRSPRVAILIFSSCRRSLPAPCPDSRA